MIFPKIRDLLQKSSQTTDPKFPVRIKRLIQIFPDVKRKSPYDQGPFPIHLYAWANFFPDGSLFTDFPTDKH